MSDLKNNQQPENSDMTAFSACLQALEELGSLD